MDIWTTYGLNYNSILNELKYFHVTSGLAPDIMHDVLEGVAVVEFRCMLAIFIQRNKDFSLSYFNHRLASFPFSVCDKK